jgi:hypothetical protein
VTAVRVADVLDLANDLLTCVCEQLAATTAGCPARRCVAPGNPQALAAESCCEGQLLVSYGRMYPSQQFPTPDIGTTSCEAPYTVVDFYISVYRCHPTTQGPTPCDALARAFEVQVADMVAVRRAVDCCKDNPTHHRKRWATGDHLTVGPEGDCVWSSLPVTVGVLNCRTDCP